MSSSHTWNNLAITVVTIATTATLALILLTNNEKKNYIRYLQQQQSPPLLLGFNFSSSSIPSSFFFGIPGSNSSSNTSSPFSGFRPPIINFPILNRPPPPLSPSPPSPPSSCPQPTDGVCYLLYAPLVCGPNNCEYANDCVAELAGFDSTTECSRIDV
jgi:hypothetical protein